MRITTISGIIVVFFIVSFLIIIGVLSVRGAASAHEAPSGWSYPKDCCADHDCRPIACSTIQEYPDGSVEWLGLRFDRNQIKISGDVSCHVCVGYDEVRKTVRYAHCIFLSPVF